MLNQVACLMVLVRKKDAREVSTEGKRTRHPAEEEDVLSGSCLVQHETLQI